VISGEHLGDEAAVYALNALAADDKSAADRHLAECPECRQTVAGYRGVADVLPLAAPTTDPDAGVRRRVMAAVRSDASAQHVLRKNLGRDSLSIGRARVPRLVSARALAAFAVVILAAVVSVEVRQLVHAQRQMAEMRSQVVANNQIADQGHAVMVALAKGKYWKLPAAEGGAWHGAILQPPNEKTAMLFGMFPRAPHGMVYRVWVIRHGSVHGAGMIHGSGMTMMHMSMPVQSGDVVAFTMEMPTNSPVPTASYMMKVTLD